MISSGLETEQVPAAPCRHDHSKERAVVIAAGMAGLASARVRADHVDEVVILDRAVPLPEKEEVR